MLDPEEPEIAGDPLFQGGGCDAGADLVGPVAAADRGALGVDAAVELVGEMAASLSDPLSQRADVRRDAAGPAPEAFRHTSPYLKKASSACSPT
jgi:hypothetical protein